MLEQHGQSKRLPEGQGPKMQTGIEAVPSHDTLTFGQVPRHGLHQRSEAGDSSNRHGGDGGSDAAMKTM